MSYFDPIKPFALTRLKSLRPPSNLNDALYYHIQENLPDERISKNNAFIIDRMHVLFKELQQDLSHQNIILNSLNLYGSQFNSLALRFSDIDMTILTDHNEPNRVAK